MELTLSEMSSAGQMLLSAKDSKVPRRGRSTTGVVPLTELRSRAGYLPESKAGRLLTLRRRAGFATATDAANAMGVNVITYIHHESGARPISHKAALLYGKFYKVPPELLLFGSPQPVIVEGVVDSKARIVPIPSEVDDVPDEVPAPQIVARELRAVVVLSTDLAPMYSRGDVLYYPKDNCLRDVETLNDRRCVVQLADGVRLIRKVKLEPGPRYLLVGPGEDVLIVDDLLFCSPVAWVRPAGAPLPPEGFPRGS